MPRQKPLPFSDEFSSPEEYTEALLEFTQTSRMFQMLCGGVHILDFFTTNPGLFYAAMPEEWHEFLLSQDIMRLLNYFVREDLDSTTFENGIKPPSTLLDYLKTIRRLTLRREYTSNDSKLPALARPVSAGMNIKKVHEVKNFADYVDRLSTEVSDTTGQTISHFVDFGSGQNYLGRALASEPYNKNVVAVEGRENNVDAAKQYDMKAGLAIKPKIYRNKKLWNKICEVRGNDKKDDPEATAAAIKQVLGEDDGEKFRKIGQDEVKYSMEVGKGHIQYVYGRLEHGDLSEIVNKIESLDIGDEKKKNLQLMAISIHSCGNLSHFGIRSLLLNDDIRAVAIVGCCYNLLTEKLGPPTYKHPFLRPSLQPVNGRVKRESERHDPQGFPMSNKLSTYKDEGVRLNITARMMACQAPQNWSDADSHRFFTRHFYRAVLQKIFIDRGVTKQVRHIGGDATEEDSPFEKSTNPVTIGTLRKSCYASFTAYVRGVIEKLTTSTEYKQHADVMREKMGDITDEEINEYEQRYAPRQKELSIVWSLMAYSATIVEALIVTDRWTFLKEHSDVVEDAWVETVFDFHLSPRNLVVVGVKKANA
ncbi:hypothetical protein VHEMI01019 [[Torrubiella] hemipterigena]|uniref:Methyltransferase domain-containing protein n=1 Tax=[Torrubiella] hemipterigena TaxID=1531966 RepID=A0A0A1T685_9HYPO|nr:hypothetical protein VHEMI01019 [[Torrubiella] hemipterigena]